MSGSNPIFLQYDFSSASYTNGLLNDLGPNNINATLVNSPYLNQVGPIPSLKSSYFNAGSAQYIQLPAFTTPSNGMSFSFWFKSNNNSTWARILDFGNGANNENIIVFINSNALGLSVRLGADTGSSQFNAIPNMNDNVWRHIVWTLDTSGNWILYLNGNSYNTYSGKYYPNSIPRNNNYLGKSNWNDPYYTGNIADFRIFNGVLSASSITNLYLNTLGTGTTSSNWVYAPSIGNPIRLFQNNYVTTWQNLRIASNSNMSVSFTINLQNINPNWRNIFHITNTNNNCCNIGDRVPAVWITAGAQSLYISSSISTNGDSVFLTNSIPLNTDTKVDIVWSGQNVKIYFNGLLNNQYNHPSPLVQTDPDANVYIADPWHYTVGGFNIQDLTFYNGPQISSSTSSSSVSAVTYSPSNGKFVALSAGNIAATWSNLNIASNSNMSVSFTINLQNINPNWRNIFHITNTNNNCCNIGDRVPAVWITAGAQSLHICNSTTNNGNDFHYTNSIPLNTDTKVDIVWSGQNIKIYFNGLLDSQYDYGYPLVQTDPDANVYIADPWYNGDATGGFMIKDLTFYNGPSIQLSTTKVYNYLGCYNDTSDRAIPTYVGNVNNQKECQDYAISNNAALYGVQYYGQCFIGNDISQAVKYMEASGCPDMGGPLTNQIYSTVPLPKPTYNYVGCYNDTSNRAIPDEMNIVKSVYDCEQLAKAKGYSVYGLQYGGYCFGSNDINAAREYGLQTDKSQCSTLGGVGTNQVYTNIENVAPLTNINPNMPTSIDSYDYKGCYNNKDNSAIPNFLGNVTSLDECVQLAFDNSYYIFGVTNNGKCYGGNNVDLALGQGQNNATAYCGTLGSGSTYQVYIRDSKTNPIMHAAQLSPSDFSDGTQPKELFTNSKDSKYEIEDINNSQYLYFLKILISIFIIILLTYSLYHVM